MKRLVLFSVLVGVVFATSFVSAQQRYPLGAGNVALKVDYFRFTDDVVGGLDLQGGVYVGVEGYAPLLMPNLYLGLETGWAGTENDANVFVFGLPQNQPAAPVPVDLETDYMPVEFNGKYVFEMNPSLVLDVGAGLSLNYFSIELESLGRSVEHDEWLLGGQLFADLNYKIQNWFIGANIKCQLTDDLELRPARGFRIISDVDATNLRAGAQVGMLF